MPTYVVTYEIADKQRRESLMESLKSYGFFCPIHDNAWAIKTDKKAAEIRDALSQYTQAGDRIFIVRSGTESAWRNSYGKDHDDWLKKYL